MMTSERLWGMPRHGSILFYHVKLTALIIAINNNASLYRTLDSSRGRLLWK